MKPIDLSIPLGVGTPAWPTYEPLQVKYFKRLAPNGANGQLVTHSNHVGTHLDGEIHFYTTDKYQLMHLEMFPFGIIHAECVGGDIDLLLNRRVKIGCFPWRFVQGESCVSRIVAFVDDDEHEELMAKKAKCKLTRYGDVARAENQWLVDEANRKR